MGMLMRDTTTIESDSYMNVGIAMTNKPTVTESKP